MKGLHPTPKRRIFSSPIVGTLFVLGLSVLLASCGPKKPKPKEALQPAPPSPVEELELKVQELESRQIELTQRRTDLERGFSDLQARQENLATLRDDVIEAQREAAERAASMKDVAAEPLAEETRPPAVKPAAEKPAPTDVLAPSPGGAGAKPYVVHTSSYRNPTLATREAKRLASKGYKAYVSDADLGAKGRWSRVLIDRFSSVGDARSSAESIKAKERLSYAAPMRLPYSVALEAYPTASEAAQAKEALEKKGLECFVVEENSSGGTTFHRLMFGAYATKAEAEASAEKATQAGAKAAVVKP